MTQQTEMPPDLTRLERLARNAALVLRWETLWPGIAALLVLVAVFLAVSWLGLWLSLPRWGRVAGVALFALGAIYLLWKLVASRSPNRKDRLARLDRDSGLAHRPASAMADALANPSTDPATQALWSLHQKRLAAAAAKLRLAPPSPRLADKDRHALRGGALVALIAAAFVAGPERDIRLMSAFDWRGVAAADAAGFRIDAWIDPPAYTGRPPVLLDLRTPEAGAAAVDRTAKVQAPVNSVLVVRTAGGGDFKIETGGGLEAEAAAGKSDRESRFVLRGDGKARLMRDGSPLAAFDLHAIPDQPPSIALTEPPVANLRGTMTLNYKIADDYGVASAEATFAKPGLRGKALTGRSLAGPPRIGLTLPATPGGLGTAQTIGDVADHPWGGATATMILAAKDEGGNTGTSEAREITLPQRAFAKPLARALAEQRRNLVLMPDDSARVGRVLDALMISPDTFGTKAAVYLGLRTAALRLAAAKSDADLLAVADYLWEMALRIEDGDISQAERDLRAAQNALREAMARGADDKELKKLMDDVRAALDKFMKELAEKQMRENGDQPQQQAQNQRQGKMLTPDDFKAMMDKIEEMAKSGNLAEAQKMLDRMQKMLENLQTAKRRPPNPQQQQMARDLNELDAMAREQQDLRDQTFKQEQKNRRRQQNAQKNGDKAQPNRAPRQKGQKGGEPQDQQDADDGDAGDDSADTGDAQSAEESQQALKDRQQALRERLDALQKRMKQRGQQGDDGLGEAEDAMKEAEGALGEGEGSNGKASGAQGRALENLRKGAQKMAQAMKEMQGEGEGGDQAGDDQGEGDPGQQQGQGKGGKDPLGRENDPKGRNDNARGLNEEGVPAARRAQQVLEELRKRLGETARPREELDYLERLLKRY